MGLRLSSGGLISIGVPSGLGVTPSGHELGSTLDELEVHPRVQPRWILLTRHRAVAGAAYGKRLASALLVGVAIEHPKAVDPAERKGSMMGLRDAWSLDRAGRWLKRHFARRALILMYHRVTELANDPYLLAVRPDHFAQHMELIRRYALPMRLGQLLKAMVTGSVPHRAIVITLDDGYADNAHEAKPILERFEIPATVFVVAGQVGGTCEFWWDELDRLLLQPGTLPPDLRLQLNGTVEEWELGQARRYSETDYRHHRAWHVERQDDPTPRHHLFRALFDRLYRSTHADKQQILQQVRTWAEADRVARPTHRPLTRNETVLLSQGGLVEIGAHTMSHPVLTELPPAEQRAEIQQSKDGLEEMLEQPVLSFAYPHGATSPATAGIVSAAGFESACCSRADALSRGSDRFQLPRLGIRDWDRDTFARWLRWWIGH